MQEAPEPHAPLYDAYAGRLHVYCWSLVGDDAPGALRDAFVTAARRGSPRGDTTLWMYGLARAACVRRGALDHAFTRIRDTDPLRQAAAGLRADHREVLVLSAGGWLEVPDIARLLEVATDTVTQLIQTARKRLERGVLDVLLPGPIQTEHEEVIAAFEKGTLDTLLARRAPNSPPAALRADVLAACVAETAPAQVTRSFSAAEGPLVVIGPGTSDELSVRRRPGRTFVGAVGLAAAAAAAAGVFATLPASGGSSPTSGSQNLLVPSASGSLQQTSARAGRSATTPQQTGASPATSSSAPYTSPGDTAASTKPGTLADPPTGGSPTVAKTPAGHLSTPTLSASASSAPTTTPSATPSATPSETGSSTPSGTPQASPTPSDTPTPDPSPSP
ncbi:MAG: polymerase, sigma-24 subunit, subfamily [Actinomycetia bacterium]|nr:polymerase, sigma-24 subunit, subfamily [Actinomycetes bacterium]